MSVAHEFNVTQSKFPEKVKKSFPFFEALGRGKTRLEDNENIVNEENLPINQKHYPLWAAIQKLVYNELDRM